MKNQAVVRYGRHTLIVRFQWADWRGVEKALRMMMARLIEEAENEMCAGK